MMRRTRLLAGMVLLMLLVPLSMAAAEEGGAEIQLADFRLGGVDLNIHNGGVLAEDDDFLYLVQDGGIYRRDGAGELLLVEDDAGNLNVMDGVLRYTVDAGDAWEVRSYDQETGESGVDLVWGEAISQMFQVSAAGDIMFLSGGSLYTYALGDDTPQCVLDGGEVTSFIPTPYGPLYATGDRYDVTLWVDGRAFAEHVTSYYIDGDYLVVTRDGDHLQLALEDLFSGADEEDLEDYDLYDDEDDTPQIRSALATVVHTDDEDECEICQANMEAYLSGEVDLTDYAGETALRASLASTPQVSQGQQNIIKRARQLHEVAWTPLADRYQWNYMGTFKAGTTYTGLPYGQPVYTGYVGYDISLDGYLDAVNNHNSSFYSGYSTYNKIAPYYSADCSSFVSYAWGISARKTTVDLASIGQQVGTQSVYSAEIGDIFNHRSKHVVLVYDIQYDSDGNMIAMALLEETPPITKLTWYGEGYDKSLADIQSTYIGGDYVLRRYADRDSVTYTHNCAAPIDGDYCGKCYVAAPKISVSGQVGDMQVTLSAASGATIYYTTDGSEPTTGSTVYKGSFTITRATTIRAIAVSGTKTSSPLTYNVPMETASAPVANISGGMVARGTVITLTSATEGATIYYTTDGSTPTNASNVYTDDGIVIQEDTVLRAVAGASGMAYSEPVTLEFTIYTAENSRLITATAGSGGTIDPSGEVYVGLGKSQTFTITPDARFAIQDVLVDGVSVGAVDSYTFDNVQEAHTISAVFDLRENPFVDVVEGDWFYDAVIYVYKAGLFYGDSDTTFSPNREITRGEFVTVLGRMADVEASAYATTATGTITGSAVYFRSQPTTESADYGLLYQGQQVTVIGTSGEWYQVQYGGNTGYIRGDLISVTGGFGSFGDVKGTEYYAGYIEWAYQAGIIDGYGDGKFGPDDSLTREQMCLILYNYAEKMNVTLPTTEQAKTFTDAASINDWAVDGVNAMQRAGIVEGMTTGAFEPQGQSTRAQVATILMRFHQL